jgi:hypothetical protein
MWVVSAIVELVVGMLVDREEKWTAVYPILFMVLLSVCGWVVVNG